MTETPVASSYIETIEEALSYFSGDPRATAFVAIASGIAWYLQRATKIIDSLPFKGQTYYDIGTGENEQERQFPRWIDGIAYNETESGDGAEVPQDVKDACCEEALALYLHYQDPMAQEVEKMQRRGATSASIGGEGSESWQQGARRLRTGLKSEEAWGMLSGYIAGAIEITF